ncbi:odorant receptor 232 [Nasonia vitripennis]|uniref:Odorant receptor n=1 Tax=Nasonia vitripennis TaxID=7425 RepID=A0A7M6UWQ2_NASVI|nr:odorant receptor 232 [Nasonia vitripennis]
MRLHEINSFERVPASGTIRKFVEFRETDGSLRIFSPPHRGFTFGEPRLQLSLLQDASHLLRVYWPTQQCSGVVEVDSIFVMVMAVSTIMRYYILVYHRFDFRDTMDACRVIWNDCTPNEHQIVRWFERKTWMLFKLLAGSGMFINVFCSIGSIVVRLPPDEPNGTERRLLPYRWFIEDREYHWLGYELIFGLQVLITHHLTVIAATVDTAGPLLMMISCGFFKALQERFFAAAARNEMILCKDKLEFKQTIVSCSKFHQSVLVLCKKIEVMTRMIFMVQLICLGYNISLIGLKLTGTDPERFQYIPNLVLCLCQLFITQWASDYLLEQSEEVATAAYFATLMSLDARIGGLLLTMVIRAQKPVQMTAGGVIKLSIERFGSLITNAISFFMVLRNFTTQV